VSAISAELVSALALVPGQDGGGATFAHGTEAVPLRGEFVDDNLVKREHPVGLRRQLRHAVVMAKNMPEVACIPHPAGRI
jgi:hypothetical protein